jgi:hypothetical protein
MPDVSDQERGRRVFQIQKEKHAEEALEKARKSLGEGWKRFSLSEIRTLKFILGEAWVFIDRKDWDGFTFARLSLDDLYEILAIGKAVERKERTEHEGSAQVAAVLLRVSGGPPRPS